jgi:hypothetical protein
MASICIAIRPRCADGDFLEVATEIFEAHPKLAIVSVSDLHQSLCVLVNPLPV